MDQDETCHAGRPRPWPHCIRLGPATLPQRGTVPPIFGPYLLRPMAAWIKMSIGMEPGLGLGDFVLDGDPAPLPQKGSDPATLPQKGSGAPQNFGPCLLWPNGWMDEAGTCHGGRPQLRRRCVRWRPSPPPRKGGGAPLPNFRPTSIVAKRLDTSRCQLVCMYASA